MSHPPVYDMYAYACLTPWRACPAKRLSLSGLRVISNCNSLPPTNPISPARDDGVATLQPLTVRRFRHIAKEIRDLSMVVFAYSGRLSTMGIACGMPKRNRGRENGPKKAIIYSYINILSLKAIYNVTVWPTSAAHGLSERDSGQCRATDDFSDRPGIWKSEGDVKP